MLEWIESTSPAEPHQYRSHIVLDDYDGFAADVSDEPSGWIGALPHPEEPRILVCLAWYERVPEWFAEALRSEDSWNT